jgi:hypothetical protein
MVRGCSTNAEEKLVRDLWLSQKERDHKKNQEIVGWMMLRWMLARYDRLD